MDDSRAVEAMIARIVRRARIPWRAARENLRRELESHFESAGDAREALRAFGSEAELVDELRRVYRRDYLCVYTAKIVVSVAAALAVALFLQLLVNIRIDAAASILHVSPGFQMSAVTAAAMVACLAAAWELARRPFEGWRASSAPALYVGLAVLAVMILEFGAAVVAWSAVLLALGSFCQRVRWREARLPLTALVLALAIGALHGMEQASVGFLRALVTSTGLAAIWLSTPAVLTRMDRFFTHRFGLVTGEST